MPFSPLLIGIAVVTKARYNFQSPFNRDSSCNRIMVLARNPMPITFSPLLIGIAVVTIHAFSPLLIGIAVLWGPLLLRCFQSPFNRDSSCNFRRTFGFQSPFNRDSSCNLRDEGRSFQSPFNRDSSCNDAISSRRLTFSPLLIGIAVVTCS